jgi:hypothetical protein
MGRLCGKEVDFHPWGLKDQFSQMTWGVVNGVMLIGYSLLA